MRTWTVVRTPTEILDAMNLYLRGIETGLESCYRLDRTGGSDLFDSSRGGHDGWFGAAVDSYVWTHRARQYDGVDDVDEDLAACLYDELRATSPSALRVDVLEQDDLPMEAAQAMATPPLADLRC